MNNLTIQIHPNPAQDVLQLTANMVLNHVELLDVFGRVIERSSPNSMNLQISVESLVNGIYYLKMSSNESSHIEHFIKN
jgi:hypothetical protein